MIGGSPAPSPDFTPSFSSSSSSSSSSSPSKMPVDFSPPLIAMVVIIATAFVLITYSRVIYRRILLFRRRYRRWRRRRRLVRSYVPSSVSGGDIESPSPPSYTDAFQLFSPYGLDESSIKTIPLTIYNRKSSDHECAVCLLEFDETDFVRTLPVCSHAFHVDCIDIWLRSHANCPLCRTGIFKPDSPFTPIMADRIRPSFDDMIIENSILETLNETQAESESTECEITQENSNSNSNSNSPRRNRDFLLKRSYSFGFERNLGSERLILETATVSPYRFRRSGGFWSKRPSPFTSMTKPRVFSFRYYRGMKSPFFRRRGSFFPLSESSVRYSGSGGGGGSSRRSKSFASPLSVGVFSSSRLRSGDPEALLSPERYNRR